MERINLSTGANTFKTPETGITISAHKIETPRPAPGSVAQHEAAHVVAAGKIKNATIIPSGNALGTTTPEKMTAAAAAAAAALGYNGTSWDMFLTEHILGVDPQTAKAAAHRELAGQNEVLHEVATILEEKKTIFQPDVEEAKNNVANRKNGIHSVEVTITKPEGGTLTYITQSFMEEITIEDDLISLSEAA